MPRYYRLLDKNYFSDYNIIDDIRYNIFPIMSASNNIISIIHDDNPKEKFQKKWHKMMSEMSNEDILEDANQWHNFWTSGSPDEKIYEYNINILSEIIDYCFEHDVEPVLVSTPIADKLNNIYIEQSPTFFNFFYSFSNEICHKYPAVKYFDYSHDKRFSSDASLFFDTSHLNIYGAKIFTSTVLHDIEELGLLKNINE